MSTVLNILIIDDSLKDGCLIELQIKKTRPAFVFKQVMNAKELREAVKSQVWDCVFCDMIMPGFGASAALEILKEMGVDLPFIVVSGMIGIDDAISLMKSGADDFVRKNELERLVPAIERAIQDRGNLKKQKDTESRLKVSEERFQSAFENSVVGCIITNNKGIIQAFNAIAERDFGYPAREIIGQNIKILMLAEEGMSHDIHLENYHKTGKAKIINMSREVMGVRKNGEAFPILLGIGEIRSEDESFFVGSVLDMTERKKAEEELYLQESRLRTAQNLVKLGYFERDLLTGDGFWSDISCEIFGIEHGSHFVFGKYLDFVHPDDRESTKAKMGDFINTGDTYTNEYRIIKADGAVRTLQNTVMAVRYDQNKVTKYVGAVRDVTEERNREDQLRQAQKMEAVGQLTGGIAHDFNNLLAIMLGNVEFLEEDIAEDAKARRYLSAVKVATKRAAALTDRLLAFSRKQALILETTDIKKLVLSLDDMLRRTLGETITLKVKIASDLWLVMIDSHQLENSLINLAINARDAMPKGGTLTIEARNVVPDSDYQKRKEEVYTGEHVLIAVSDTGSGISPEVLKQVYEPFFTTKDVGEGSGLGLSMVYGFIKQSGGHISIESVIEQGTVIKLYLPKSKNTIIESATNKQASQFNCQSERILVVEDDEAVREVLTFTLSSQGYEVVEASNGKEAIQHLMEGASFDLLFTDMVLPGGINGIDIATEAKRIQPGIMVLYSSGYAESAIERNGKMSPNSVLIRKPYNRVELLEKIQTVLSAKGDKAN